MASFRPPAPTTTAADETRVIHEPWQAIEIYSDGVAWVQYLNDRLHIGYYADLILPSGELQRRLVARNMMQIDGVMPANVKVASVLNNLQSRRIILPLGPGGRA